MSTILIHPDSKLAKFLQKAKIDKEQRRLEFREEIYVKRLLSDKPIRTITESETNIEID